jgi:hypothetical protein
MNSKTKIAATRYFPRDMVCLRKISVGIIHKGDTDDDDDDDDGDGDDDDDDKKQKKKKKKKKRCGFRAVSPVLCNSFAFKLFRSPHLLFGPIFT